MTRPPREVRRARRRRRRLLALLSFGGAIGLVVTLLFTDGPFATRLDRPGEPPLGYLRAPLGGRQVRVSAWTLGSVASLEAATRAGALDEVDFGWYHVQADGSVTAQNEDLELVAAAREHELNVFATVTNTKDAGSAFSRPLAAAILASPERRRRLIDDLVRLVEEKGYDGIDLDWEGLKAADRDRFSSFVEELAAALHEKRRFLSIAVTPKTSEPGRWDGQIFVDWARVGRAVDEFKIMTYSYSGSWSDPGPQAPLAWVDQVLSFAQRKVPAHKISMGVPFYGFDWHADSVSTVSAHRGAALAAGKDVAVGRDTASQEATLSFTEGGVGHEVLFQDETTLVARLARLRARHPEIAGISIWVMGQEAGGFWPLIARELR
jgi:spore germination protein YaaH